MSETRRSAGAVTGERDHTRLYVGVIAVEVLVLSAIWVFQRYFGL